MKIFYYTFGCKVNQYETENIRETFEQKGYETVTDHRTAQIALINTCTVTKQSDMKCRQLIHKIKRDNPQCVLILAGCFSQAFPQEAEQMNECDIIAGSNNKREIPALTEEFLKNGKRIIKINPHKKGEKFEAMKNLGTQQKTRAYIKIQDGCDRYCTYCIIPYSRGHICSKALSDIRSEAEGLIHSGHKEIILTGINLCCYGKDLPEDIRLIDAIETVCRIEGEFRVRLSSIEPELISDEDIIRMSKLEKLCPHFHLSLQSGCNKTLKAMNRHYTAEEYAALCQKLRKYFKDPAITTDIMVGFAGETEEDFEASMAFAEKISFAEAHIFPYSKRPGTVAYKMEGHTDKKTKQQRAAKMADVCSKCKKEYLENCVGKTFSVLFEKENSDKWHQGHAPNYVVVRVKRNDIKKSLRREIKNVKITHADDNYCYGEIVK